MDPAKPKQCWECRRRRLVCDFTRPKCRKCQVRGVDCPGYDRHKPLKWLQPRQVNSKGRGKALLPPVLKAAGEAEMSAVFEAIEYYNVHIAPDLVATGAIGPETPYFMPCSTAPYLPRSFTQCFVCTSLCHRLLQSGAALQSDQLVLARRLQRHRGDALRALTADLASPEHQTSDLTLASVIVLLLVEIQQSLEPPDWRYHSKAAAVMMELKGGLADLVLSRPHFRHLFRYYALIEIIGNTTSPSVEIHSAREQLELVSLLPVLYGDGLRTSFPCPPDLLVEIIRINHLRSVFRDVSAPRDTDPALLLQGKHSAALDVLRRIRGFPADKWATEVLVTIMPEHPASQAGFSGWRAIACVYQSAIAIYCIASLLHQETEPIPMDYHPGNSHLAAAQEAFIYARKTCASALLAHLQEASRCTQLRKLLVWPLVIAGIEAEDEAVKRFVVDELQWISHALGTAAPLVAKDLLEKRVWAHELGRGSWERVFDREYAVIL